MTYKGIQYHTLWIANDNDFLTSTSGPNVYYVIGLTDADLESSRFAPQQFK